MEVGGVEPPSPDANRRRLQVYAAIRVVEEGMANRRALPPVFRVLSLPPSGPDGRQALVGVGTVPRSGRRRSGSVAIGAYAARARVPLLLARKRLPNQEIGGSTCNPRS